MQKNGSGGNTKFFAVASVASIFYILLAKNYPPFLLKSPPTYTIGISKDRCCCPICVFTIPMLQFSHSTAAPLHDLGFSYQPVYNAIIMPHMAAWLALKHVTQMCDIESWTFLGSCFWWKCLGTNPWRKSNMIPSSLLCCRDPLRGRL